MNEKYHRLSNDYELLWGDLHNHNAVGYAKGSLERSIDIAREHLDFFAFTGHASWHDMPKMPGDRHMHWVNGFKAHSDHWPKTRKLIEEANVDGFVSLLGYEWHSSSFGDFCLIFPDDQPDLYLPDNPKDLFAFAKRQNAFAIPHHVAYKQGWRGANWSVYDPEVAPVVEIFSEHGCTESDHSPYPMILHSNGGRSQSNTVEHQLARGLRFGFVASTDDHFGYPGAYGEGIVGVWANDRSREAIFEAISSRRTYAVTGDRIGLEFTVNDSPMGSELPDSPVRRIAAHVSGGDSVHMIELIKNGRVIRRHFPEDTVSVRNEPLRGVKCRIQYGWGPWSVLDLARTCRWDLTVSIEGGTIGTVDPCFQAGPYEEDLRDTIERISDSAIRVRSFTSRRDAYLLDATKSIVLSVDGDASARLIVEMNEPADIRREIPLPELVEDNDVSFTGVFTSESFIVHRLVFPDEYSASIEWEDERGGSARDERLPVNEGTGDWYYLRVRQHNGHLAWSSPVWVG